MAVKYLMSCIVGYEQGNDLMTSDVSEFDWVWDANSRSTATLLSCDNRKVNFHSEYSCGTAAIRGSKELAEGQHFWEIKMTSPVYGTDMVNLMTLTCPQYVNSFAKKSRCRPKNEEIIY